MKFWPFGNKLETRAAAYTDAIHRGAYQPGWRQTTCYRWRRGCARGVYGSDRTRLPGVLK